LQCQEGESSKQIKVSVISKSLNLDLKDILDITKNTISFSYSLSELAGMPQKIILEFIIMDKDNQEVTREALAKNINANEIIEDNYTLEFPKDLSGEYKLVIKAESDLDLVSDKDTFLLNQRGLTGLALLNQQGQKIVPIVAIISIFLVASYFVIRRMWKTRKIIEKRHREIGYIRVKPNN